ncbi:alpha/beta fold hydrolase [Aliiroseovarius sp. 2305UL8-7]|uniref:alpha/beta fold hydrolase n=1 Tax=Aliiroseovarius conchicola TaxID=3121637 RepID=UPI003526D049
MTLTTLRLSRSGLNLSFQEQGHGEPVVLVHGVGMQSAAWTPQIRDLSETHRVIAIDLPGHGGSDPLPDDSQLPDFVRWFGDVIETMGLPRVNVAGHSMGALIAGGFAVEHPERISRVALINGVFRRDADASRAVIARAAVIRDGLADIETPLARWFGDTPVERAARDQVAGFLRAVDQDGYATAYAAFAHGDATYADKYAQITCPFLAMTGDEDPNSTPAMSTAMAQMAQNGRAISINGHRHMVNLTAPEVVSAHLNDWLNQPATTEGLQHDLT